MQPTIATSGQQAGTRQFDAHNTQLLTLTFKPLLKNGTYATNGGSPGPASRGPLPFLGVRVGHCLVALSVHGGMKTYAGAPAAARHYVEAGRSRADDYYLTRSEEHTSELQSRQ